MKKTEYKDTTIHYRVFGNGNPLVFLHGFLEDSTMWDEFIKPFEANHKIILVDLPCHGQSRFIGKECSMIFMANAVKQILDIENVNNPKVIGHSMGGYVGLELAKLTQINLTLLHSNFWADSLEKKIDRDRVVDIVKNKKEFFISEAIPNLFYLKNRELCCPIIKNLIISANNIPENEIIAATLGMKNRNSNSSLLETININIIQGEYDTIITQKQMLNKISEVTKPQKLYTIKDCGHMSFWEKQKDILHLMKQICT